MKRSAGVTASAVIVLIGSALALLWSALMIFGVFAIAAQDSQPKFVLYFIVALVVFMFAASGWGIASGVGLLNRKGWARISMLIFSGILLFFTLPGLVMIPFLPFQAQSTQPVPASVFTAIKIGMSVFYAALSALAAWWLYFFNTKRVKEEFRTGAAGVPEAAGEIGTPKRPLSIAIIGWYLLVTSPLFLVMVIFHFPIFFFGYMVTGSAALAILLTMAGVQIISGIGLLKLRPWGRVVSICYFIFGMVQAVLSAVLPGSNGRFQEAMATVMARFGTPVAPIHFSPWFSVLSVIPLYGVLLWFLFARKRAFENVPA